MCNSSSAQKICDILVENGVTGHLKEFYLWIYMLKKL
jgi:NADH/NAD ratio-sensing transcriptional regulator Rex